ncbi:hypothetical protein GALMADRAFT_141580 [Galerina marginata CBS 339.88]|uniref:Uncharacterized protein n=1 Tax=Galerina marginata (strain CBS 339.88) TaxID=685588 RepID=A0A067T3Q6_GALM3|nr:hypothetical protein GALMADRAFT_141580 [Galerina marginata CBS 339.88]
MFPMNQGEIASPPTQIDLSGDNTPETNFQGQRRDILAFRSITHFRAAFLHGPPIRTDDTQRNPTEQLELKLSFLFASLAILHCEIIAAVMKKIEEDAQTNSMQGAVTSELASEKATSASVILTQNPRSDDKKASLSTIPILLSPAVPIQFEKFKEERTRAGINEGNILDSYIREVLHSQGCQTILLDDHVWMLQEILNTRCAQDILRSLEQLLLYMVIACFRKLSQRMCHVQSKLFLQALTDVDLTRINFEKAKAKSTITATLDQISIDNGYLAHFLTSRCLGGYEYTHLKAKATISNITFYDNDTFEEFHHMLLSILETYQTELERMRNATGNDALSKMTFKKAASNVTFDRLRSESDSRIALHWAQAVANRPQHLGRDFLQLTTLGKKPKPILPSTRKGGPYIRESGADAASFARMCRCILNHMPIGLYYD